MGLRQEAGASYNATKVFIFYNASVMVLAVNSKRFKKWLTERGATFAQGKGGHLKVLLNGRRSVLPMHSGELKKGLADGIKKQLGLKE